MKKYSGESLSEELSLVWFQNMLAGRSFLDFRSQNDEIPDHCFGLGKQWTRDWLLAYVFFVRLEVLPKHVKFEDITDCLFMQEFPVIVILWLPHVNEFQGLRGPTPNTSQNICLLF